MKKRTRIASLVAAVAMTVSALPMAALPALAIQTTGTEGDVNYGDANLDGKVDLTDAIVLNKYLAKLITASEQAVKNMNVYLDENVDENDTTYLMKFVLNMEGYQNLPIIPKA